jgi:hypothetical protein
MTYDDDDDNNNNNGVTECIEMQLSMVSGASTNYCNRRIAQAAVGLLPQLY